MTFATVACVLIAVAFVATRVINASFALATEKLTGADNGRLRIAVEVEYGGGVLASSVRGRRTTDGKIVDVASDDSGDADALIVSGKRVTVLPADLGCAKLLVIDDHGTWSLPAVRARFANVRDVAVVRNGSIREMLEFLGIDTTSPGTTTINVTRGLMLFLAYALIALIGVGVVGYMGLW